MDKTTVEIKVRKFGNHLTPAKIVMLCLLGVAAALAVWSFVARSSAPTTASAPVLGNSQANIANRGLAAATGALLYFSEPSEAEQVYVANFGEGAKQPMEGVRGTYLNVQPPYLFYVAAQDGVIRRRELDSGEDVALSPGPATALQLFDEVLYYIDLADGETLHRMDVRGERIEKLSAARVSRYALAGTKIYFRDEAENGNAYRMNLDGTNPAPYQTPLGNNLFFRGGKLYYVGEQDALLYSVALSGEQAGATAKVCDTPLLMANFCGDYLYFADVRAGGKLSRVSLSDGGGGGSGGGSSGAKEVLGDDPAYALQSVGDWILYANAADGGALWRLSLDGSVHEKL